MPLPDFVGNKRVVCTSYPQQVFTGSDCGVVSFRNASRCTSRSERCVVNPSSFLLTLSLIFCRSENNTRDDIRVAKNARCFAFASYSTLGGAVYFLMAELLVCGGTGSGVLVV